MTSKLNNSKQKSVSALCLEQRFKQNKCASTTIFDYLTDFEECLISNEFCGCCDQITKNIQPKNATFF